MHTNALNTAINPNTLIAINVFNHDYKFIAITTAKKAETLLLYSTGVERVTGRGEADGRSGVSVR